MQCPFCNAEETKVIDSRLANDGDAVRRRRECLSCTERFTTYETAELVMPRIVKSDGSRVPFDEVKLSGGIMRSLEKRPVETEQIDAAISHIKQRLRATGDREVPSLMVGECVMDELRELDHVAYVRFASVYRSFEDINEFREEIERLEREPSSESRRQQLSLLPIGKSDKVTSIRSRKGKKDPAS